MTKTHPLLAAFVAAMLLLSLMSSPIAVFAQDGGTAATPDAAIEETFVPAEAPQETVAPVQTVLPVETQAPIETVAPVETLAPVETVAPVEPEETVPPIDIVPEETVAGAQVPSGTIDPLPTVSPTIPVGVWAVTDATIACDGTVTAGVSGYAPAGGEIKFSIYVNDEIFDGTVVYTNPPGQSSYSYTFSTSGWTNDVFVSANRADDMSGMFAEARLGDCSTPTPPTEVPTATSTATTAPTSTATTQPTATATTEPTATATSTIPVETPSPTSTATVDPTTPTQTETPATPPTATSTVPVETPATEQPTATSTATTAPTSTATTQPTATATTEPTATATSTIPVETPSPTSTATVDPTTPTETVTPVVTPPTEAPVTETPVAETPVVTHPAETPVIVRPQLPHTEEDCGLGAIVGGEVDAGVAGGSSVTVSTLPVTGTGHDGPHDSSAPFMALVAAVLLAGTGFGVRRGSDAS